MSFPNLDETCKKLLPTFIIDKKPFRFNELYRFLNDKGFKISKPTLSLHLKHLSEKKLVLRKEIDKQYVTYQVSYERFQGSDEFLKRVDELQKIFEEGKENFDSSTAHEQVNLVHLIFILRGLYHLKFEMLRLSDPEHEFQHVLESTLYSTMGENFERWLLQNFYKNNEEFRKEIIDHIENYINQYTNRI